jgi:hypothetical protein
MSVLGSCEVSDCFFMLGIENAKSEENVSIESVLHLGFQCIYTREGGRCLRDAKPKRLTVKHWFYTEVQSVYKGV